MEKERAVGQGRVFDFEQPRSVGSLLRPGCVAKRIIRIRR